MKSRLAGTEAQPQTGGLLVITQSIEAGEI